MKKRAYPHLFTPVQIVSDGGIPLYVQLKDIVKDKILKGEYKQEGRIPPENELCSLYGVSRITVRQALNVLVQEKLIYRKQGRGTFLTSPKIRRQLPKLYGFSDDMRELGLVPSSKVQDQKVEVAQGEIAALLRLPAREQRVSRVVRVRLANGEPILLERTYVPYHLCPNLIESDLEALETGSLYQLLTEKYGLVLHTAQETYEVVSLKKREAVLLQSRQFQPAFAIERIAYLRDGTPVELTRSLGRGDRLRLALQLVSDQTQFIRKVSL